MLSGLLIMVTCEDLNESREILGLLFTNIIWEKFFFWEFNTALKHLKLSLYITVIEKKILGIILNNIYKTISLTNLNLLINQS